MHNFYQIAIIEVKIMNLLCIVTSLSYFCFLFVLTIDFHVTFSKLWISDFFETNTNIDDSWLQSISLVYKMHKQFQQFIAFNWTIVCLFVLSQTLFHSYQIFCLFVICMKSFWIQYFLYITFFHHHSHCRFTSVNINS